MANSVRNIRSTQMPETSLFGGVPSVWDSLILFSFHMILVSIFYVVALVLGDDKTAGPLRYSLTAMMIYFRISQRKLVNDLTQSPVDCENIIAVARLGTNCRTALNLQQDGAVKIKGS